MFVCGDDAGAVCVSGGEADLDAVLGAVLGGVGTDPAGSVLLGGGSLGVAEAGFPPGGGGDELDLHLFDEFTRVRVDSGGVEDASAGGVDGGLLGSDGRKVWGTGGALATVLLVVSSAGVFEAVREPSFRFLNSLELRNLRCFKRAEFDIFSLFAVLVLRVEAGFGNRWAVGRFHSRFHKL